MEEESQANSIGHCRRDAPAASAPPPAAADGEHHGGRDKPPPPLGAEHEDGHNADDLTGELLTGTSSSSSSSDGDGTSLPMPRPGSSSSDEVEVEVEIEQNGGVLVDGDEEQQIINRNACAGSACATSTTLCRRDLQRGIAPTAACAGGSNTGTSTSLTNAPSAAATDEEAIRQIVLDDMNRALRAGKIDNHGLPSPPPPDESGAITQSQRQRQSSGGEASQEEANALTSTSTVDNDSHLRPADDLPSTVVSNASSITPASVSSNIDGASTANNTATTHINFTAMDSTAIDSTILDASHVQTSEATSDEDDRRNADFVLAYLKRKGLDTAAADVAELIDKSNGASPSPSSSTSLPSATATTSLFGTDMEERARREAQMSAAGDECDEERMRKEREKTAISSAGGKEHGEEEKEEDEDSTAIIENAAGGIRASDIAAAGSTAAATTTSQYVEPLRQDAPDETIMRRFFTKLGQVIGEVSAAAASTTATSTRRQQQQQQPSRHQGRAPSRGGTIETSNSGSLQQLQNLSNEGGDSPTSFSGTVQDGTLTSLEPMLNPEEPGAPIMIDMDTGDLDDGIEAATIGANQRNRVSQPGAYAVSVPAVSAPPSEPARRRMFRRNRNRHRDREMDFMDEIENAIFNDMPLEAAEAQVTSSRGGGWRSRGRRQRRPSAGPHDGDDGGVVTVVQATAVEDEVFEASILEDKDGLESPRWSTSRKIGTVLTAAAVIALVVGLAVALKPAPESDLPVDIAVIGEVCVNEDPTTCGCYNQADYRGFVNTTLSGHTCLTWGVQDPHEHVYFPSERWPELEANYCRNPDESAGAWCYTTDPDVRWEYCNVPQCDTHTVPITVSPVAAPVDPPLLDIEAYCDEEAVQPQEETSGIYLDGETAHIVLTNTSQADSGLNFDGNPLTIEAWIKPEPKVDFATILSNKEGGSGKTGFLFSVNTWEEQNGKLYFEGTYGQVASTKSVQWGKWQHVAVTYDGTNPAFYIDGEQIPFFKQEYYGPFSIQPGFLDAKMGEMGLYYSNSYYKGSIDELKVWDYARTGEEIRSSMHCMGDPNAAGLISYYQFEKADNRMVVHDSGPRGNHGVIVVGEGNEESENGGNGSESSVGYVYTEGIPLCTLCSDTS